MSTILINCNELLQLKMFASSIPRVHFAEAWHANAINDVDTLQTTFPNPQVMGPGL